jgi:hypothetical protein
MKTAEAINQTARRAGIAAVVLFCLFGVLHLYWALGGSWGLIFCTGPGLDQAAQDREPAFVLLGLWGVASLSFAAAAVILGRLGMWGRRLPRHLFGFFTWLTAMILLARSVPVLAVAPIVLARRRWPEHSWFWWDLFLFSPLFLLGGLLCLVVALARAPSRSAPDGRAHGLRRRS